MSNILSHTWCPIQTRSDINQLVDIAIRFCLSETLRKYPVLGILNRTCLSDYKIPGTNKVIEKGTEIIIPVLGLHNDSNYWPEPKKFDPNRFGDEQPTVYYAFGDGPRNCIGSRLGKMQTKVGLVFMLQKFTFKLEDTREMKFDVKSFLLSPEGGLYLRVLKR